MFAGLIIYLYGIRRRRGGKKSELQNGSQNWMFTAELLAQVAQLAGPTHLQW